MLFDERDATDLEIVQIDWMDLVKIVPYRKIPLSEYCDQFTKREELLFVGSPFELSDDDLDALEAAGRFGCVESRRNLNWGLSYRWGSHELPPLGVAVGHPHARGVAIRERKEV